MNFLDIPEDDKIKLGKIINYYRVNVYKERYPDSWSINNFVQGEYGNICSSTTLSQIENGVIIKDNDIYDEILNKLGQKYNYEKNLSDIHKAYGEKIIYNFENYKDTAVTSLIKDYIVELNPYKNYIFEKEFIYALEFSLKTVNMEMKSNVNKLLKLFSIYPASIRILIADRINSYIYNFGDSNEKRKSHKVFKLYKSNSYRLKTNRIYTLLRKKYYYKAMLSLLELQNYYEKENNILGQLRIYSIKLILLEEIGSTEWFNEVDQVLPIFKEHLEKDNEQIITYIHNIAIGCTNRKKYNLALELFVLVLKYSSRLYLPTAIYVNQICTITGDSIPSIANCGEYNSEDYPEVFNIIYRFYLLKNDNTSASELEEYIFKSIRPIFNEFSDDSLYNIFKLELEKCIEVTGHSNLLYKYNRIRRRSS